MASFVAGFHVQEHKVFFTQCIEGSRGLAFVVGVVEAGGSLDLDYVQTGIMADAFDEVDGRDDAARLHLGK